ncbi:MAG: aminotransferase class I/II-fold pyridoxal phosphate-dependent enzyme [Lachnospiraceae bacterium]|nr:aminotransferase class I/II-fold pyridoxal phosphate-dependent enzyme [Lachnospiraceae bacterium]
MSKAPLRLEQYDTILYNANLNPMGVPDSVTKALSDNMDAVIRYPGDYYGNLKSAIAVYLKCDADHIVLANGSADLLHKYAIAIEPKRAMVLVPTFSEYETVLKTHDCEMVYYELEESKNYQFDLADFVGSLDSSLDMIIIGNPNNPTSQIISRDDLETLAEVCKELDIFLIIDEMYIEFTEDYKDLTSVPLVEEYDNIAVLRSVSKFFAVPGLRLAYAIMNNKEHMSTIETKATTNSISSLTAVACLTMFRDTKYIEESRSQIYTERNLIYSAMATCKKVKLYKPFANFMLVKLLDVETTAQKIVDACKLKGIVIRNCENIRGLDNTYIRFCFMKPTQNDLLVNTIIDAINS